MEGMGRRGCGWGVGQCVQPDDLEVLLQEVERHNVEVEGNQVLP